MARKKKKNQGWKNYRGQNDTPLAAPSCVGGAGSMIYHTKAGEVRSFWVEGGSYDRYSFMSKPKSKGYKRAEELLRIRNEAASTQSDH